MLYLPTYIFGLIHHKQYWTPADLLEIIVDAETEYDIQIERRDWNMMKQWCLAATQLETPNATSSPVALTAEAITQADTSFLDWCKFRLTTTLGTEALPPTTTRPANPHQTVLPQAQARIIQPTVPAQGHTGQYGLPTHTPTDSVQHTFPTLSGNDDLATQVGRGIALGFQAFSNAGLLAQGAGTQGGASVGDDKGKAYSPDAIAALKGFTNTHDIKDYNRYGPVFKIPKM